MKSGINQLLSTFMATLIMTGYLIYQSLLFAAPIWFIWVVFNVGGIFGIGHIEYLQIVGLLFAYKMFRFDPTRISHPIVVPKEALPNKKPKEQNENNKNNIT